MGGELVCGRNNCGKFGLYFHDKDDCCEKPTELPTPEPTTPPSPSPCQPGWSAWSEWSCVGTNRRERRRTCRKANCSLAYNCVVNDVNGVRATYIPQVAYTNKC